MAIDLLRVRFFDIAFNETLPLKIKNIATVRNTIAISYFFESSFMREKPKN